MGSGLSTLAETFGPKVLVVVAVCATLVAAISTRGIGSRFGRSWKHPQFAGFCITWLTFVVVVLAARAICDALWP
jgi:hypothetical protein